MATKIDIELTSRREEDGTFTWRAAGAREPKGVAAASLFPDGSSVGEQFKVEAEVELDGITIVNVIPPKDARKSREETLELLSPDSGPLVTQELAGKGRGGDRKGRGRGRSRERGEKRGDSRGGRDKGRDKAGSGGRGGERQRTPAKPALPPKPKPPRLKAGRAHRTALLDSLPEEQKPVAQELVRGGLQAVRKALTKQNEQQRAEGAPEIEEGPMLALAEQLLARVRAAEWRDRAEAALEQADVVDVRDLRSVVTAADSAAKDDETRALSARLRTALNERLDAEHNAWVNEIIELLDDDRVVRALHLSSRPPKAGAPLPAPVAMRLVEATNAAMNAEITLERWGYMLEALAHSPVRRQVVPASLPKNVSPELEAKIARYGSQLPEIAEIFGVEPDKPRSGRSGRRRKPKGDKGPKAESSPAPESGPQPESGPEPQGAPEPQEPESEDASESPGAQEPAAADEPTAADESERSTG